jgi:ABC-2 type transport system permease protein
MTGVPHIRLLAWARWQSLINSIANKKRRWQDLAGKIVITIFGSILTLGAALAFGVMVYSGYSTRGGAGTLGVALGIVFWMWQFLPVITAASMHIEFSEIARYPISFPRFCLLELSAGVLDPVALVCLTWLAACWIGVLLGRPPLALRAALMILAMAAVTLLINRLILDYLERLLSTRKGRARFFGGMMLLSMAYQIVYFTGRRIAGENLLVWYRRLADVASWLPAGLAAGGVGGSWLRTLNGLACLGLYAAVFGWPLLLLYRRKYQGEVYSDGRAKVPVKRAQAGWRLPGLSTAGSAMLEKEVRYLLSQPMGFMTFLWAPVMALLATFGSSGRSPFAREMVFPIVAAWVILLIGGRAYNSFCFDSNGFGRYLLAPVTMREVILSKNLMLALLMFENFFAISLVLSFRIPVSGRQFLSVALGFLMAALASLAIGNFFSVIFPSAVDLDRMRSNNASGAATLGTLLFHVIIIGILAGTFYWKLPAIPVFATLSVLAAAFYRFSLDRAARWAELHGEEIARMLT